MKVTRAFVILLAAALLSAFAVQPAAALDPDRSVKQLHHTAWGVEDGAPSRVTALAQTTDGYLWVGSPLGLFRFDGMSFERYAPPGPARLPSYNIYALAATPDGGLWVSFRPSGLGFIKGRSFTAYPPPGDPGGEIYTLAIGPDGRVWAGRSDGVWFRDSDGWHQAGSDWNIPNLHVTALSCDHRGTLWVANETGIYSLAQGSQKFVPEKIGLDRRVQSLARSRAGRMWYAQYDSSSVRPLDAAPGFKSLRYSHNAASCILFDRDDCMWVCKFTEGLLRVRGHEAIGRPGPVDSSVIIESFTQLDGLSAQVPAVLLEDSEGSIWVGTNSGIDRFRHNDLVSVALPPGNLNVTLVPADSGGLWVGGAAGPPAVVIRGDIMTERPELRLVDCFYRESSSVVWWGGSAGIFRQQGDRITRYRPPPELEGRWIWELLPGDAPGSLWAYIDEIGLIAFEDGGYHRRTPPPLPDRGPTASFPAADGRLWLGFNDSRVSVLDHGRITNYSSRDGLDVGRIRVIRERAGRVWVGGELGLNLFHNGKFTSVIGEDGSPFGTVSGIIETGAGDLWLNELRGIVHVPREEVSSLLTDSGQRIHYRRYDIKDGMPGGGQMNFTCSTAAEGTDGRLWFATFAGLVWIDPGRTASKAPLRITVRSVDTDSVSYEPTAGLRLPKGTSNLTIRYAAMTLADPERIRYRYRLDGVDDDWQDASTQHAARYTRLKPGRYGFRVMAANADGVWSQANDTLDFSITPRFYQTPWFIILMAVTILAAAWGLSLLRLRQVTHRLQRLHDERMDERMRIAHDLHDTLLQSVISASLQLQSATKGVPAEIPARERLEHTVTLLGQVTVEARNAVRDLRESGGGDGQPGTSDLASSLAQAAREFGESSSTSFLLRVVGEPQPMRPNAHDEVYCVGKECLANAYRHADARTVEVELSYLVTELVMVVRDDGRGIEPEILTRGRADHWGIGNMRERASRMSGRLSISRRPDGGTEVMLAVPGRVAYLPRHTGGRLHRIAAWLRPLGRPHRTQDGER